MKAAAAEIGSVDGGLLGADIVGPYGLEHSPKAIGYQAAAGEKFVHRPAGGGQFDRGDFGHSGFLLAGRFQMRGSAFIIPVRREKFKKGRPGGGDEGGVLWRRVRPVPPAGQERLEEADH